MKVVVEGTKTDGEKFRKEIERNIESLDLSHNQLFSIDLSPLAKCTNLQKLLLINNRLASLDLSPLKSCQELWEFSFDEGVSIVWRSADLDLEGLSYGLKWYAEEIKQAWEEFIKEQ